MMYQHTETRNGLLIELTFENEEVAPSCIYGDDHEDIESINEGINSGEFAWVVAVVKAKKAGITLSATYLGAVHYKYDELNQFIVDGYYEEMVSEVIEDASNVIQQLITN